VPKRKDQGYSPAFKRRAVERMQKCDNVVELARQLGVPWRTLYKWKEPTEGTTRPAEIDPAVAREQALQAEIAQLKGALADKVLEVNFFKGALRKIEARRRSSSASGEASSTGRSER
jgi:transposase